jgi:hypothetical protein
VAVLCQRAEGRRAEEARPPYDLIQLLSSPSFPASHVEDKAGLRRRSACLPVGDRPSSHVQSGTSLTFDDKRGEKNVESKGKKTTLRPLLSSNLADVSCSKALRVEGVIAQNESVHVEMRRI